MNDSNMRETWLVQRLEKPYQMKLAGREFDNPFSFGGGLPNGGLSKEAMNLLRPIFAFDYMGSAEFEYGAVPEAIQEMVSEANDFAKHTIIIKGKDVKAPFRFSKDAEKPDEFKVYLFCRGKHKEGAEKFIREDAAGKSRLKERTDLNGALMPYGEYPTNVCGWLEIDNGFMFFTDEHMCDQVASLFSGDREVAK